MRYRCYALIRHHTLPLMVAGALLAQGDKPLIHKAQARSLMEPAVDMVSAVTPDLHAPLLRDLGMLYAQLNRKKAVDVLNQGFQAALAVADPERSRQQGAVVKEMTAVDPERARDLLRQLPPEAGEGKIKPEAYERVLGALLEQGKIDDAFEALTSYGAGEYPYKAATALMTKLPENDARRLTIFGAAAAAYQATPRGDFGGMITKTHAALPKATVQSAITIVVDALLRKKDGKEQFTFTAVATGEGSASFGSDEELSLFKLFKVLDAIDPKKAAEVLEKKPGLRDALKKLPEGVEGRPSVTMTNATGDANDPTAQQQMRKMAFEADLIARLEKNPREGLDAATKIEDADLRGQALARIASMAAEGDPALAETALTRALEGLDKMEKPLASAMTMLQLVHAARDAKLKSARERLIEKGFSLVERLAKEDRDAKAPNTAPRDLWPSTQITRMLMFAAGEALGPDAIPLLERWRDPELRLVAQVALARSLLGLEIHELSMSISR